MQPNLPAPTHQQGPVSTNTVAIRKRTQIAKTNRMMFIWIAIASAIIGAAIVVSIFLTEKLIYNERVLTEKQNTITVLDADNKVIPDLVQQIRVLDTNAALMSARASDTDQAIQVILDALPSDANSLALGASLQNKLLAGIPGLTLESLKTDPVVGVETLSEGASANTGANEIDFQFSVSGNQAALKQALTNMERSIRSFEITSLRIESQGSKQIMSVQAKAFYEPAKTIELKNKVVQP